MTMDQIKTVAIVEDVHVIRQRLVSRINKIPHLICLCDFATAEEAIEEIPKANPDLVIMDIGLPGMNGIQCMLELKKQHPEIGVLMYTIFDTDETLFDALKCGANGYILKDEKSTGIIEAIDTYFEGGAPMSALIARKVMDSFHHIDTSKPIREVLSNRQQQILELISQGFLNKEIAAQLNLAEGTIKVQINRIYNKLEVNNRVEAVNKYLNR